MARFDQILTPATNMVSRMISNQLRRQAPVDTGRLKRSIHVTVRREGGDGDYTFTFEAEYNGYGIYTDLGTGPYGVTESAREEWNPNPGKGKGGIKPRFWNSLSESVMKPIEDIIVDAVMEAEIQNLEDTLGE
jgi:hypothetical protein